MNKLAPLALLSLATPKRPSNYSRNASNTSHSSNPRTSSQDLAPYNTTNNTSTPLNSNTTHTTIPNPNAPNSGMPNNNVPNNNTPNNNVPNNTMPNNMNSPTIIPSSNIIISTNPQGPIHYSGAMGNTPYMLYTSPNSPEVPFNLTIPGTSTEAMSTTPTLGLKDNQGNFILPPLNYSYSALEPYIDTQTMQIHHTKHHQKYISELNRFLSPYPELKNYTLEQLLASGDQLPENARPAILDNAGGNYNHSFFWKGLSPSTNQIPSGALRSAIIRDFGSTMDWNFLFKQVALSVFGAGWAWLLTDPNGNLLLATTANQNTPIPLGLKPLVAIDLWEHAHYLKTQNSRGDYIDNWFNLINWQRANQLYEEALNK